MTAAIEHTADKFWMVWNPSRSAPRYMHKSKELAENEAKRLASGNPGDCFFVLKATTGFVCTVNEPTTITLAKNEEAAKQQADDPHGHIPF